MSVLRRQRFVAAGDLVLIYEGHNHLTPLVVEPGKTFQNKFGIFKHSDLIGMEYGTKVFGKGKNAGWVQLLHLTPDLWTLALSHRTQILYHADISFILLQLGLRPGSVVAESGTGSGSLSTAIARTVAPHGHLYTFEFNKDRVQKAREDFKRTGVDSVVTIRHRDVCANGFPMIGGGVDAVFLDLPTPWTVIPSAKRILRPEGMICCFSPCIEQVQRTCAALREHHFTEIRTFETLLRDYDVSPLALPAPDFTGTGRVQAGEVPRRQKRPRGSDGEAAAPAEKRARTELAASTTAGSAEEAGEKLASPPPALSVGAALSRVPLGSHPFPQQRGHTGYLTFARRWARWTEDAGYAEDAAASTTHADTAAVSGSAGTEPEAC